MYIRKTKFKKRSVSCPSLGCSSCSSTVTGNNPKRSVSVVTPTKVLGDDTVAPSVLTVENEKVYKTRFFYSSGIVPKEIEALLARKSQNCTTMAQKPVTSRFFTSRNTATVCQMSQRSKIHIGLCSDSLQATVASNDVSQPIVHSSGESTDDVLPNVVHNSNQSNEEHTTVRSPQFESTGHGFESHHDGMPTSPDIVVPESGCESNINIGSYVPALSPDLYSTDVVGSKNVTMNSQSEKNSPLEVSGHRFESHYIATSAAGVQQPSVTTSGIQTVHSVEGSDSCVNESIPKSISVNTVFNECDQLCFIYDVNNAAMEEKSLILSSLPTKVTKVFQYV